MIDRLIIFIAGGACAFVALWLLGRMINRVTPAQDGRRVILSARAPIAGGPNSIEHTAENVVAVLRKDDEHVVD